jgi:hypothetical protein
MLDIFFDLGGVAGEVAQEFVVVYRHVSATQNIYI